jgi:catechol 2,3-dioxygenase-like lactoylglutathione lyase family enzyme
VSDIGAIHHTGLTVRDLDRSVTFYRDVLGCSVIMEQEKVGGYLAEIVGYPDTSIRMAHLYDPAGRLVVELFEYRAPQPLPADLEPRRIGNAHLCFVVADLAAVYQRLVDQGVETFTPPVPIDTGVNAGGSGLYLRDPDGITLELFQPAPGTAADSLLHQGG